ncbi:hypothetical protein D0B54_01585 [Solimonas sp. K1W22B-7]|uniref:hypothetical protein n=1 Tax=Solimonas sp. K1W22B-7 TaxID=2303331 RepID=UPI000E3349AA|nr:hypothetical protein [Solimonas sp. K1W22B-7]AXQ27453.1 hypothetical protein D0B54_01585 [Solimonas sp. K1W22B-7]
MTMNTMPLMPEQALLAYRDFLRQVLTEVVGQMRGEASLSRLMQAMQVYWDACFDRRSQRTAAVQAAAGTRYAEQFESLGQPFLKLLRAELAQIGCPEADALSRDVYLCARNITVEEARTGRREMQNRQNVLYLLRHSALES